MFVIYGLKGITYTKQKGEFHCPACRAQQLYRLRRVRRFFTLYFIPLIPLNQLGEYVECRGCKGTYVPDVIHHDFAAEDRKFDAQFESAIKRVMVMMMLADGVIDGEEMQTISQVFEKLTGHPLSDEDLLEEVEQAKAEGGSVSDFVSHLVSRLNPSGRELVLKAAFFVAAADGVFQDEEKVMLSELADALQIRGKRFKEILDELLSD